MQTPLRRSRRGQPAVVVAESSKSATKPALTTDTRYSRKTTLEDLIREQVEQLEADGVALENLETQFVDSFTCGEIVKRPIRVYGKVKGKRPAQIGAESYAVGDTVFVKTVTKEPSIAVITAIWKVVEEEKELCLNVALHWFVRPQQLPSVRVRRSHDANEIYYTLSQRGSVPATSIVGLCKVTSAKSASSQEDDDDKIFYCSSAIDSHKGFYYEFDWNNHHREALQSTNFWESTQQWDVTAIIPPETPQKKDGRVYKPAQHKNDALPAVQEEEEPDEDQSDLESPSKRKRKRSVRASASPSKRARTSTQEQDSDYEDGGTAVPTTPSRRGRKKTVATPQSTARGSNRTTQVESDEEEIRTVEPQTPSRKRRGRPPGKRWAAKPSSKESSDEEDHSDYKQEAEQPSESEHEEQEADEEELQSIPVPRTPSRRNRGTAVSTPRKRKTTVVAPTPHSKAALRARAKKKRTLAVPPPPPDGARDVDWQLDNVPKDPWLRAMHVLHVSARPEASKLPCREEEYARVLRAVEELLEEGSGGCIYISGVPGTGKTATVHAVVRELKRMAEQNETNPFTYVEINGLRIPEPSAAYSLLWEAVSGHDVSREGHLKISAKESLKRLTKHFGQGERDGPGGHACVVLMDELDQLMTTKQDVVYNFFNWPTLVGSKLVVLAVANTMDLPERVMTGRVRSRLGMVRINFQPYTTPQLEQIVKARLLSAKEGLPGDTLDVVAPDGIKFAAMKVSSISGDARRVLDICRRAVELVQPQSRAARTDDVKKVIVDMQNSPTAAYLRELSFHERLMLAALLRCVKREGVEEIKWGDVQRQHILHLTVLAEEQDTTRSPSAGELGIVLDSLVASRAILCEDGHLLARKPEDEKRVVLNLEHAEVERVLGEVGGTRWKNALNI